MLLRGHQSSSMESTQSLSNIKRNQTIAAVTIVTSFVVTSIVAIVLARRSGSGAETAAGNGALYVRICVEKCLRIELFA